MASDNVQNETGVELADFSGMLQRKTSTFQRRVNELWDAENVDQRYPGAITKARGYTQTGDDITEDTSTSTSTSTTTTSTSTSTSTSTTTT